MNKRISRTTRIGGTRRKSEIERRKTCIGDLCDKLGEWPSGLYSLRQVTEVKLGRVMSDSGWVISEA